MPLIVQGITPDPNSTDATTTSSSIIQHLDKPCVEIILIHLRPGYEDHMEGFYSALERVSQALGFRGCRWGMRVEKDASGGSGSGSGSELGGNNDGPGMSGSEVLEIFIDWESFKCSRDLMRKEDYPMKVVAPLTKRAFSSAFETFHFFPKNTEGPRLTSPVSTVRPDGIASEANSLGIKVLELCKWNVKRFVNVETFLDIHEELENVLRKAGKGVAAGRALEKANTVVLLVGWDSVESHYGWKKDSDEGKAAIAKVKDVIDKVEMHHVRVLGEMAAEN